MIRIQSQISATKTQRHKNNYIPIVLSAFVALWLLQIFNTTPLFAQSNIETILNKNLCSECHAFNSQKTLPFYQKKAPDIFYAGEKFQEKWLLKFFIAPEVIRPNGYITDPGFLKGKPDFKSHPTLSKEDAKTVARYLLSLKPGLLEQVNISKNLKKGRLHRAKQLFERQYGCSACHRSQNLMGLVKGGLSGPSLSNAGNRLKGKWIFNMLKNPTLFEKKGRMPVYKIPEKEILLITEFLLSQQKENERK